MMLALVSALLVACGFVPSSGGGNEQAWLVAAPAKAHASVECAAAEPAPEPDELRDHVRGFGAAAPSVATLAAPCGLARIERRSGRPRDPGALLSAVPRGPPPVRL